MHSPKAIEIMSSKNAVYSSNLESSKNEKSERNLMGKFNTDPEDS